MQFLGNLENLYVGALSYGKSWIRPYSWMLHWRGGWAGGGSQIYQIKLREWQWGVVLEGWVGWWGQLGRHVRYTTEIPK